MGGCASTDQPQNHQASTRVGSRPALGPVGKYVNGGPSVEGGTVTACFPSGLLYCIVKDDTWYYYNDSSEYQMKINFSYDEAASTITVLNATKLPPNDDTNWPVLNMTLDPAETKAFVQGTFNGYKSSYDASPLSEEYKAKVAKEAEAHVEQEIARVEGLGNFDTDEARLAACVQGNVAFVDLSFKPLAESLSKQTDSRQLDPKAWLRPTEFLPEQERGAICVYNAIKPDDIDQGQLGDCWFLCSVAALAEYPDAVKALFAYPPSANAKAEQSLGAYRLTLSQSGWWRNLILDDYLPCVGGRPCFAKNDQNLAELWPALIEKAYAKQFGSYAAISGGDPLDALQDLTGYPTYHFDSEWKGLADDPTGSASLSFFGDIVRHHTKGYIMVLTTPGVDDSAYMGRHGAGNSKEFEELYKKAGLGMGHAYSILDAKEFTADGVHLLKIRNPWGNAVEWTGDWSYTSDMWGKFPTIAAACGALSNTDGTFWMSWVDVLKFFCGGGTCFTKFDWYDYRVQGAWESGTPNIVLEVTVVGQEVDAFLTLSQTDTRGLPQGSPDATYASIMLTVCRPDASSGNLAVDMNSSANSDKPSSTETFIDSRDVGLRYRFTPNEAGQPYLVVPRIWDKSSPQKTFVLGVLSDKPVSPGAFTVRFKQLPPDAPVFQNYAQFAYNPSDAQVVDQRPYQLYPDTGCPVTTSGSELTF